MEQESLASLDPTLHVIPSQHKKDHQCGLLFFQSTHLFPSILLLHDSWQSTDKQSLSGQSSSSSSPWWQKTCIQIWLICIHSDSKELYSPPELNEIKLILSNVISKRGLGEAPLLALETLWTNGVKVQTPIPPGMGLTIHLRGGCSPPQISCPFKKTQIHLPVSLSRTLLIIWMAFLFRASGFTKPSPTEIHKSRNNSKN
jgi:hypothetical protein